MADNLLSDEQAQKLQEGISVLNSILSRAPSLQGGSRTPPPSSSTSFSRDNGQNLPSAPSRALQALRSVRSHFQRDGPAAQEHKNNFAPYAKPTGKRAQAKAHSWTVKMVCLAQTSDCRVPSTVAARELLIEAGLGEKKVIIPDINMTAREFFGVIVEHFPKLHGCGGFELLRCISNSRNLEAISPKIAASPKLLKAIAGTSKIYIRPIQRDLDLEESALDSSSLEMMENCINCGESVPVHQLRTHMDLCKPKRKANELEDSDDDFLPAFKPSSPKPAHVISSESESEQDTDLLDTECIILDHAIKESTETASWEVSEPTSLMELLKCLHSKLSTETYTITVRRGYVFVDALRTLKRATFSCYKKMEVEFLMEEAVDGGGPSREFACLVAKAISASVFEGSPTKKVLVHDSLGLQENKFYLIGQLMAMTIVNCGGGYPFFAPSVLSYLCGVPLTNILVDNDEVPDYKMKTIIEEMYMACDEEEFTKICLAHMDEIIDSGYTKPVSTISLDDRESLTQCLKKHLCILKTKGELDQLKSGLNSLGVGRAMEQFPNIMSSLFLEEETEHLTADKIKALFKTLFSDAGSTEREKEAVTYMLFLDLLHECEEQVHEGVCLQNVLSFFSGAEAVPPVGFETQPSLYFSSSAVLPTASTCALSLTLPTCYYNNPIAFKEKMTFAIMNHGGFGLR